MQNEALVLDPAFGGRTGPPLAACLLLRALAVPGLTNCLWCHALTDGKSVKLQERTWHTGEVGCHWWARRRHGVGPAPKSAGPTPWRRLAQLRDMWPLGMPHLDDALHIPCEKQAWLIKAGSMLEIPARYSTNHGPTSRWGHLVAPQCRPTITGQIKLPFFAQSVYNNATLAWSEPVYRCAVGTLFVCLLYWGHIGCC